MAVAFLRRILRVTVLILPVNCKFAGKRRKIRDLFAANILMRLQEFLFTSHTS